MLPKLYCDTGLLKSLPDLLAELALPSPLLMVCDTRTYEVAGRHAERVLGDTLGASVNLGLNVKPTRAHVDAVKAQAEDVQAILAIGSGTLNDIAKLAAYELNLPYVCLATAASMNGYTSATASILQDGLKQSVAAAAPLAVIADLDILRNAPLRLGQAGLGDMLCRATVQADALLSHILFGTWYDAEYFANAALLEQQLLAGAHLLPQADAEFYKALFHALVFSGNAMQQAASSAPASQGEHMIAHSCELLFPAPMAHHYHGEHIAVTTLSSLRLQHYLMAHSFVLLPTAPAATDALQLLPEVIRPHCVKATGKKALSQQACDAAMQRLEENRERLRAEFADFTLAPEQLENTYQRAEMASWPESLDLTREEYDQALQLAHLTRDRFTFLDIAAMRRRA